MKILHFRKQFQFVVVLKIFHKVWFQPGIPSEFQDSQAVKQRKPILNHAPQTTPYKILFIKTKNPQYFFPLFNTNWQVHYSVWVKDDSCFKVPTEGFLLGPICYNDWRICLPAHQYWPSNKNWNLLMSAPPWENTLLLGRLMVNMQPIIPIKNGHKVEKSKVLSLPGLKI